MEAANLSQIPDTFTLVMEMESTERALQDRLAEKDADWHPV
jgi:hypothetical protein